MQCHLPAKWGQHRLTHAVFAAGVRLVANVADAAVAPSQVLAHPVGADLRVQGALVNV